MLCVTRTPLRVSLFGGGTDYPAYFERAPGAVVGFAINRYIYISSLILTAWQSYNYRVAYSRLEHTTGLDDIQHPIVREVLRHYGVTERLDIGIQSDLPASGGLGSSSAFTVGFVNLVASMFHRELTAMELARKAMFVEQDLLAENVGVQDQLHTAFGGANRFDFEPNRRFRVTPLHLGLDTVDRLNACMVLIHTGVSRRASDVAVDQIANIRAGASDASLARLYAMVNTATELLERGGDVAPELGRMLREAWAVKRQLAKGVASPLIDELYDKAIAAGAYGGKLCGAGGGGFLMMLIEPHLQAGLARAVAPLPVIPIEIDVHGSTLIQPPGGFHAGGPARGLRDVPRVIDGGRVGAQEGACAS